MTLKCWHRFSHLLQPDDILQALAMLMLEKFSQDNEWTTDIGDFARMTGNLGILENLRLYLGIDTVLVGDGSTHEITHISNTYIGSDSSKIKLNNVLLVPDLAKNLLSIGQLTLDYPVNCDFSCDGFTLLSRRRKGNLYVLSPTHEAHFLTLFQSVSEEVL